VTSLDWLSALMRWTHVIAAITWIGDSLLFMWIDSHLMRDPERRKGVDGVTWLLHSGGYYRLEKRALEPGRLPPRLRWFWIEATSTWVSGFLLLILAYYWNAAAFMVEPGRSLLSPGLSVAAGIAMLVLGWAIYDWLWSTAFADDRPAVAIAISAILLLAVIVIATHLFSARAAFMHVGALLGTIMAANVWMHIIFPQQKMVAAARAGRDVDPALGEYAKVRSTHNTYLTFPVIFLMLSNHAPGLYAAPLPALVIALLIVLGGSARQVMYVGPRQSPGMLAAAVVSAVVLAVLTWPRSPAAPSGAAVSAGPAPAFADVRTVIVRRCAACHSETPTETMFTAPAGNVTFDTPRQIQARAARIKARAVEQRTMPLANKTGMPDEERALLGRWVDAGAPLR
jgi:uncharacterized membrane protein